MSLGDMAKNSDSKQQHGIACGACAWRCSHHEICRMMRGCGDIPADDRRACIDKLILYAKPS